MLMKRALMQTMVVTKTALILLWPVSAWAATIAFGEQMAQIPLLSVLMTLILSTLMGATALLHSMKQEYERTNEIQRLWLFVSSKMLGANAAGLLMFFAAESCQMENSYRAAAIMLSAFGGNFVLDRALQFFVNKYVPESAK
jgi:predicted membrane-bound spermidine synthase